MCLYLIKNWGAIAWSCRMRSPCFLGCWWVLSKCLYHLASPAMSVRPHCSIFVPAFVWGFSHSSELCHCCFKFPDDKECWTYFLMLFAASKKSEPSQGLLYFSLLSSYLFLYPLFLFLLFSSFLSSCFSFLSPSLSIPLSFPPSFLSPVSRNLHTRLLIFAYCCTKADSQGFPQVCLLSMPAI